jgi:hypothetical protein
MKEEKKTRQMQMIHFIQIGFRSGNNGKLIEKARLDN